MTDRSYVDANERASADLGLLATSLSADALLADAGDGWTVAVLLAHLGFWDRWQVSRWEAARAAGAAMPDDLPDGIADLVNATLLPTWRALPTQSAVALALDAAADVDRLVAGLPDASVDAVAAAGRIRLLDRSLHRAEHVSHVRRALGGDAA